MSVLKAGDQVRLPTETVQDVRLHQQVDVVTDDVWTVESVEEHDEWLFAWCVFDDGLARQLVRCDLLRRVS